MCEKEHDDYYATCEATYATLRIYASDLDPGEVTKLLDIVPTSMQKKGDLLGARNRVCKLNGWFLSSESNVDSRDSRRHIDWILDQIAGKSSVFEILRKSSCRTDVSCYWLSMSGHGGPALSPSQMKPLAEHGLDFWYDVYFLDD